LTEILPGWYAFTIGPLAQLAEQLTLNQLVEGSSPSRLTRNVRLTKKQNRANWRGSVLPGATFVAASVQKNVER
jgi:hypothetical protein